MDVEQCQEESSIIMNDCDEESTSSWFFNGDGSISARCNWELVLDIQSNEDSKLLLANIDTGVTFYKMYRA